jgi:N-acetylmuramoyl-L-alanine amidase
MLALTIWREARNQSYDAKRAVAWSVMNRVALQGYMGRSIQQVLAHPWAYTSMTGSGDPNLIQWPWSDDDQVWQDCLRAAQDGIAQQGQSPIGNATHYYDRSIPPPNWTTAPTSQYVGDVGSFHFWKVS